MVLKQLSRNTLFRNDLPKSPSTFVIRLVVIFTEKRPLTSIPPLGNMVRVTCNDHLCHGYTVTKSTPLLIIQYGVPEFILPEFIPGFILN